MWSTHPRVCRKSANGSDSSTVSPIGSRLRFAAFADGDTGLFGGAMGTAGGLACRIRRTARARFRRRTARLTGGHRRRRFANRLAQRSRFRRGLGYCLPCAGGTRRSSHTCVCYSTGRTYVTISNNPSTICHRPGVCFIGLLRYEIGLFMHQVACFVKCRFYQNLHGARHERMHIPHTRGGEPQCA